jgi:hypothetical protein
MFVPRPFMCLDMGASLRRGEGFVFLSKRHICCMSVPALTWRPGEGICTLWDTIHALSIYYNCVQYATLTVVYFCLLLCSFVCCALFERGGLFCVLFHIVLPLPTTKNLFVVK